MSLRTREWGSKIVSACQGKEKPGEIFMAVHGAARKLERLEGLGQVQVIRPTGDLPASRMTRDRDRILQTLELGGDAARSFLRCS